MGRLDLPKIPNFLIRKRYIFLQSNFEDKWSIQIPFQQQNQVALCGRPWNSFVLPKNPKNSYSETKQFRDQTFRTKSLARLHSSYSLHFAIVHGIVRSLQILKNFNSETKRNFAIKSSGRILYLDHILTTKPLYTARPFVTVVWSYTFLSFWESKRPSRTVAKCKLIYLVAEMWSR